MAMTPQQEARSAPSSQPPSGQGPWLLRGEILSLHRNPFLDPPDAAVDACLWHESDGALLMSQDGHIELAGAWEQVRQQVQARYPSTSLPVVDARGHLLVPGLIDAHCHFPQLDLLGTYSGELLEWLNQATFPLELGFADSAMAHEAAQLFISCLYEQGTTTAAIYASSHHHATEILFEAAWQRGLRALIGKVSMDRHAPAGLLVDVASDVQANEALIQRWHGRGDRLHCALTPRFAPSCSPELFTALRALSERYPDLYWQTHHAENLAEVAWVQQLYPDWQDYLDVYERFGVLGPRTLLAHSIHLNAREEARIASLGAHVVHCPSSNLFLGSGLCRVRQMAQAGVSLCLGTDVGAGTSFSLWQTMAEAHKVSRMLGAPLHPVQLFHLATLGGAEALGQGQRLGSLAPGKFADIQVIDWQAHPLLRRRFAGESPSQKLFSLMHFVDRGCIKDVWVQGRHVYSRDSQ